MANLNKNSDVDLIYYYPTSSGAPSEVSRYIFKNLLKNISSLPFRDVKIFSNGSDVEEIKRELNDLEVLTIKDFHKISPHSLIHIPMLPIIFPNSKFLLYIYSVFMKKGNLILQYHGDIRNELIHSDKNIYSLIGVPTYILVPKILKSANKIIVPSYYMQDIVVEYGIENSTVIPNGVDNFWFEPPVERNDLIAKCLDKNNYNIFFHGRLSWEKGVDLLIKAAGVFIKKNPKTKIYLAGDGSQRKSLRNLCLKLGIAENVVFLGNLDKRTIKCFLCNVDIAIYPSRFDSFSLSILEALACSECVVYFSKKAGISNFVSDQKSLLNCFEPDIENLTYILESNSSDSNNHRNIIETQKNFAINFQWDIVVSDYIQVYNKMIERM